MLENGAHVQFTRPSLVVADMGGGVTLNGSAHYDAASDVFTLTPDALDQRGGAMSRARLHTHYNFNLTFNVNLLSNGAGADGMAFVLHNDGLGSGALGVGGAGVGARSEERRVGKECRSWRSPDH